MNEKYLTLKRQVTVAVEDVDYREILKPSAILNYFQDVATAHAKEIGIGYEEMKESNLCWVITKLKFKTEKTPAIDDRITVQTFPKKPRSVEATRNYYIENEKGEILVRGIAKWCVIDFITRSIKRCDTFLNYPDDMYCTNDSIEEGCVKIPALSELDVKSEKVFDYTVRITDLDRNHHMNNAKYGDCVLNALSIDELNKKIISTFDMNFITELKVNEIFTLYRAEKNGELYFEAIKEDGKIVFRAKVCLADK